MATSCFALFDALGMKEEFGMLELFNSLRTMHVQSKIGKRKGEEPNPLDRKQVEFAITIVNILAGGIARHEEQQHNQEKCPRL